MKVLRHHTPTDNKFYEHSGYAVYWNTGFYCKEFQSAVEAARFAVEVGAKFVTERVIQLSTGIETDGKSIPIIEK